MGSTLTGLGAVTLLAAWLGGAGATQEAALCEAAGRGEVQQVRALLAAGARSDARDAQGRPALVRGAEAGSVAIVSVLLEAGADKDVSDSNGLTALIAATRVGHVDVARVLLEAGADPDMRHRGFGTALDIAEHDGARELVTLLRAHGARGSGHSTGDTVCVRPWDGSGYCARIQAISGVRYRLRLTRLVGCERGCEASACSDGRSVGGETPGRLGLGDELWVESACLTHTACPAEAERSGGAR